MSFIPILDLKKVTRVYMSIVHGLIHGDIATTLQDRPQPPTTKFQSLTPTDWRERAGKQGPNTLYKNRTRFVTAVDLSEISGI